MSEPIATLVPNRSDKEVAEEIKTDILTKIQDLCKVMDDAKEKGFMVQFNLGLDWRQRNTIQNLVIAKLY